MTTVTIQGLAFYDSAPGNQVVSTTMSLTMDDRYLTPSYRLLVPGDEDYDAGSLFFEFDNEPITFFLDDAYIGPGSLVTGEFVRVDWTDAGVAKTADIIFVEDINNDVPRVFKLAGDELPVFTQASDLDQFQLSLDAVGPITTGPFRPGVPINLTVSDAFLSVSDHDFAADFDDLNDVSLGAGDDFFVGMEGNDIADMGYEPNDYDIVSYFSEERFILQAGGSAITTGITATLTAGVWSVQDLFGFTDTITNVEVFDGTTQDDSVTGDGSVEFLRFYGYNGDDVFNGHQFTFDSIDYRRDANEGGSLGINADLAAGTITDGFGDTDTVSSIDEVRGTAESDTMRGSAIDIRMRGEGGDDHLYSGSGNDRIEGGDGVDMAHYNDSMNGVNVNLLKGIGTGHGRDTYDSIEIVVGSNANDVIVGNAETTLLNGRGGDDILRSKGAATELKGGSGNDKLFGDDGDEMFDGGNGDDIIKSGRGNDEIDTGAGANVVRAGQGNDEVNGGADDDKLFGNGGNDTLRGGDGKDTIDGGNNLDHLFGEGGNDALKGGGGRDFLDGGAGNDNLFGGSSVDTFIFSATDNGADKIKDWADGSDLIDLTDFGFASFAEVEAIASNAGSFNMKLVFGGGDQVVIENFRLADFDESDVLLM